MRETKATSIRKDAKTGGFKDTPVEKLKSQMEVAHGADLLIATPGRLIDFVDRNVTRFQLRGLLSIEKEV